MLFPIARLVEDKQPLCVESSRTVREALALMVEHDYSLLPVIDEQGKLVGVISERTISRNYYHSDGKVPLLDLTVDHCLEPAATARPDDDLFHALDQLQQVTAVVIVTAEHKPISILTDYDSTNFFRDLYADLLRVEDIEVTLRQRTEAAFPDEATLTAALMVAFGRNPKDTTKPGRDFHRLTLGAHLKLIQHPQNWPHFQGIFDPPEFFDTLLKQVLDTRNQLAHFRDRLSVLQRDALMRAYYWIENRPKLESATQPMAQPVSVTAEDVAQSQAAQSPETGAGVRSTEAHTNESLMKYAPLQRWLADQTQDPATRIVVSYEDIERLLGESLPISATEHRTWWANDRTSRTQARAWLDAGWRVEDVDRQAKVVTFRRDIVMRKFFAELLEQLKSQRLGVAQGVNPPTETACAFSAGRAGFYFDWAFSRNNLGVEFFIDTEDRQKNKEMFSKLETHRAAIEQEIGMPLIWQSKEQVKLSKVFVEHTIDRGARSSADLEEVKQWAVETMVRFVDTFRQYMKDL